MNYKDLIEPIVALAIDAGGKILEVYATEFDVQSKADESPLTQADLASNRAIVTGLQALTPDIPIISEEDGLPSFAERSNWNRYWLIDPLDGTREFVNRNGEFTVNIGPYRGSSTGLRRRVRPSAGQDICGLRRPRCRVA